MRKFDRLKGFFNGESHQRFPFRVGYVVIANIFVLYTCFFKTEEDGKNSVSGQRHKSTLTRTLNNNKNSKNLENSIRNTPDDQVPFVHEAIPAADEIPIYLETNHGVPDPEFAQPQPRHSPHPIIVQQHAQPPPPSPPQQAPQHVYDDMTPGMRAFAVRSDRRWAYMIQVQTLMAQHMGIVLPPSPDDVADDDDADDDDA